MSIRFERANSEIQRCLSDIIQNKMNDPRLNSLLYVSEVNVTPDFKFCKIKIALDTDNQEKLSNIISVLQKSEGFIKRELVKMVKMPQVPKLNFVIDKGTQATIRVNELLKTIEIPKEDNYDE